MSVVKCKGCARRFEYNSVLRPAFLDADVGDPWCLVCKPEQGLDSAWCDPCQRYGDHTCGKVKFGSGP